MQEKPYNLQGVEEEHGDYNELARYTKRRLLI